MNRQPLVGCRVQIVEGEDTFTGVVENENKERGRLKVWLDQGELQIFFDSDISSVKVLKVADDKQEATREDDSRLLDNEDLKNVFHSVRPDLPFLGTSGLGRPGKNCHLTNLHGVNMDQLLGKVCPINEEDMPRYKDSQGHKYFQLPAVSSSNKPRIDVNGQPIYRQRIQGTIRHKLWKDEDTPPQILTPSRLYIVDCIGDLYEEAVEKLRSSRVVGFSSEGSQRGRAQPLFFVLLTTTEEVFMFDIQTLGEDCWMYGLRMILQDQNLLKIVHDCRTVSDCLYHQHNVKLDGVWDCMAGDILFTTQAVWSGLVPRYNRPQASLLTDYLGIDDDHIGFPRYRREELAEDLKIWSPRPLPKHMLLLATRSVLYLPALYQILNGALLLPFHRAVAILNSHVRDMDDPDADSSSFETHLVPNRVRGVLPSWGSQRGRDRIKEQGLLIDGDFVHNKCGNPDPVLIFSKDSMHQTIPTFSPFTSIFEEEKEK